MFLLFFFFTLSLWGFLANTRNVLYYSQKIREQRSESLQQKHKQTDTTQASPSPQTHSVTWQVEYHQLINQSGAAVTAPDNSNKQLNPLCVSALCLHIQINSSCRTHPSTTRDNCVNIHIINGKTFQLLISFILHCSRSSGFIYNSRTHL